MENFIPMVLMGAVIVILFIWNLVLTGLVNDLEEDVDNKIDRFKKSISGSINSLLDSCRRSYDSLERELDGLHDHIAADSKAQDDSLAIIEEAIAKLAKHIGVEVEVVTQPEKVVQVTPIEDED